MRARLDARDALTGRRDPLVPPRRLGFPSQIHGVGAGIVRDALLDGAALQPGDRVLDVGCGPGRTAAHLVPHLDPASGGRYDGFDVMPDAIRWAQRNITRRHPAFRFEVADLRNDRYRPGGAIGPAEYTFPYPDGSFDVAVAASLYTHMFPRHIARYLAETARVLRSGGRSAASFFLINPDSEERLAEGLRTQAFAGNEVLDFGADRQHPEGGRYRTTQPHLPEARLAVHEEDVRAWHEAAGLEIVEVRLGSWAGRDSAHHSLSQDWVFSRVA